MACKQGEVEYTDYDGTTYCVESGSGNNVDTNTDTNSSGSTWDKIMEAADKILQGAEIVTGYQNRKTTKRKGDFGNDVIDRNDPYYNDNTSTPQSSGTNWVLIAGIFLGVLFLFLVFKMFAPKSGGGATTAATAPSVK